MVKATPDGFDRVLRGSHRRRVSARVVDGLPVGDPAGGTELRVLDGEVTLETDADVRGQLDVLVAPELYGPDLFPEDPTDLLAPYGVELYVELIYDVVTDADPFVLPLGYFLVELVEQPDGPGSPVRVTGRDRSGLMLDQRLTAPRQYPAGSTLQTIVDDLLADALPGVPAVFPDGDGSDTIGRQLVVERDRWEAVLDLAVGRGLRAYFAADGQLTLDRPPDPTVPVFTVNAGPGGVLVSLQRSQSREGAFNGVVASGEAPSDRPPVRALVVDDDPASPTYWFATGPRRFGQVPRFYTSSLLTTVAQCEQAAAAILRDREGLPYRLDLGSVPAPQLEPDDVLDVRWYSVQPPPVLYDAGGQLQLPEPDRRELHTIRRVRIPCTNDEAQTCTTLRTTGDVLAVVEPGGTTRRLPGG